MILRREGTYFARKQHKLGPSNQVELPVGQINVFIYSYTHLQCLSLRKITLGDLNAAFFHHNILQSCHCAESHTQAATQVFTVT